MCHRDKQPPLAERTDAETAMSGLVSLLENLESFARDLEPLREELEKFLPQKDDVGAVIRMFGVWDETLYHYSRRLDRYITTLSNVLRDSPGR
jgi:hypothetical protein